MELALDSLCEFLQVAIHGILYVRNVYPSAIFVDRRKYNVPVKMSVHPDLNLYIERCITSSRRLVALGVVDQIRINVDDAKGHTIERFIIEIALQDRPLSECNSILLDTLGRSFRTFCLQIYAIESQLGPPAKDTRFSLQVVLSEDKPDYLYGQQELEDFPWVEAEEAHTQPQSTLIPLRSMSTDIMKMQLFVTKDD